MNPTVGTFDLDLLGKTVLVVDDLPENVMLLKSFLLPFGFKVQAAHDGPEALAAIAEHPPDIILLDLVMPGMSGFDVCRHLKESIVTRHIPIIIITGVTEREANIRAVEAGADDFLVKPFDRVLLEARIRSSLRAKLLHDRILDYQHELEEKVKERTRQLAFTQQVAVFSLAKLAESRDQETGQHLDRIRSYARTLVLEMANQPGFRDVITPDFIEQLYESAPLHDVGKVGIPDRILLKPGKLTSEEFKAMEAHSKIGGDTLRAAEQQVGRDTFLSMGRDIAYFHHERWDGNGYPFGLKGGEIPLAARITALADVYDALRSNRPYKTAFSHSDSRHIILEGAGAHFDPDIAAAFKTSEDKFIRIHDFFMRKEGGTPISEAHRKAG